MSEQRGVTIPRCLPLASGMPLAAGTMPLAEVVVLFVLASFLVGLGIVVVSGDLGNDDKARSRAATLRTVVAPAGTAGVATISLAAVATVSALLALLALIAVMACSPGIRHVVRTLPRRVREPAPEGVATTAVADPPVVPRQRGDLLGVDRVHSLTSRQLRLAWAETYDALRGSTSAVKRIHLVEWRRACLDELERRDPAGMAAWFAAEANATTGLEKFIPPDP